jgi:threonine synthase
MSSVNSVETKQLLTCRRHGPVGNSKIPWACPQCGATLRVAPDLSSVDLLTAIESRPRNIYRFAELLPIQGEPRTGEYTGYTPLIRADRLGATLGLRRLYLKLDCYNWPSYSYKDRVAASALQRALEIGASTVACVSTGNVGNSVAALAAAAGLKAVIFYPANIEPVKSIMSLMSGASVIQLDGSFDEVNNVCRRLALQTGIPFLNLTLRPYYAEGAKTVAYEVVEQLGWEQPDHVIVPTAGAALLTRMAYGFEEMSILGMTHGRQWPRMHAAQAAGCAPIANAFAAGELIPLPCVPNTMAKSISIGNPSDGSAALDVIMQSLGSAHGVSDQAIVESIRLLAGTEGVFTEPAGGAAVAVIRRLAASGVIAPEDTVVVVISGSGLKTQEVDRCALDLITYSSTDYDIACTAFLNVIDAQT